MSRDAEKETLSQLQHDAEHQTPPKPHSAVLYLAILFAAAFLLLLLTYFMQQRTNEAAISGLKESINSMQSVQDMIEENSALHDQITQVMEEKEDLLIQIRHLETQLVQAKAELSAAQKLLDAAQPEAD